MSNINKVNNKGTLYDIEDSSALKKSSIVTNVDSSSTDSQVPSAKFVYDKLVAIAQILSELFSITIHYDPVNGFILDDGTEFPIEDIIDLDAFISNDIMEFKQNLEIDNGYIVLENNTNA